MCTPHDLLSHQFFPAVTNTANPSHPNPLLPLRALPSDCEPPSPTQPPWAPSASCPPPLNPLNPTHSLPLRTLPSDSEPPSPASMSAKRPVPPTPQPLSSDLARAMSCPDGSLIVTVASSEKLDLLLNWVGALDSQGLECYLVGATDEHLAWDLVGRQIPVSAAWRTCLGLWWCIVRCRHVGSWGCMARGGLQATRLHADQQASMHDIFHSTPGAHTCVIPCVYALVNPR